MAKYVIVVVVGAALVNAGCMMVYHRVPLQITRNDPPMDVPELTPTVTESAAMSLNATINPVEAPLMLTTPEAVIPPL